MHAIPPPPHLFTALLPNLKGVDFFVGDIHGAFERLAKDMETAGFDPSRDRLICVGDLVDRGEDSDVAAQWLEQPFFHAIRGNHEDLYLRWRQLRDQPGERAHFEKDSYWRNGGRWVHGMDEADHRKLQALITRLPYFMAVAASDGRTVGVVHAELPDGCSWPSMLHFPDRAHLLRSMTWGRERLRLARAAKRGQVEPGPRDGNLIQGLDVVVCGHVVVRQPTVLGNIVYLDTAGWSRRGYFSLVRLPDLLDMVQDHAHPTLAAVG